MATQAAQTIYLWQGIDAKGRETRGEMPGGNPALVKAQLRKQGVSPTRVKRKPKDLLAWRKPRVRPRDIAVFTRQLATMMKSNIALLRAFDIAAESLDNPTMRELVMAIRNDVAIGNSLADAIARHPRHFDDLFCALVAAGEQSGTLETMLERLAAHREKSHVLQSRIRKALIYPAAVVVVATVVTGILLVKVVPKFAAMYASFNAELPAFTQFVLKLSALAIDHWWQALIAVVILLAGFGRARRRWPGLRARLDRMVLHLPVAGVLIRNSCCARFSRTLATAGAAGVPLVDALASVAGTTGNLVYGDATRRIRDDVTAGQQLAVAIANTTLFPVMITQMVAVGEESGALDTMLDKCAAWYESEVENAVDGLTALLEPLIMAALGVLVGGLIIAMYLPVFQLGAVM